LSVILLNSVAQSNTLGLINGFQQCKCALIWKGDKVFFLFMYISPAGCNSAARMLSPVIAGLIWSR
jgi:hypothetical protein